MTERHFGAALLLIGAVATALHLPASQERLPLMGPHDKTLYALGLALAESVGRFGLSPDELDLVQQGLAEGVLRRAKLDLEDYRTEIDELSRQRIDSMFTRNEARGSLFRQEVLISEPSARELVGGVIVIPLQRGSGKIPADRDRIRIAYTARLIDDSILDRTREDESIIVGIDSAALACLSVGLTRVRSGGAIRLICPPEEGFHHPRAPPGSTLVYDVELLEVVE